MKPRLVVWLGVGLVLGLLVSFYWRRPFSWKASPSTPATIVAAIRGQGQTSDPDFLVSALKHEDADVRLIAAQHLAGSGPDVPKRAEALIEALKDPHASVRREAARSLGEIGPEVCPSLAEALQDNDPRVRAGAALAVRDLHWYKGMRYPDAEQEKIFVGLLTRALKDTDVGVRRNAALALGRVRTELPEVETARPALRAAIDDEDADVRKNAASALDWISRRNPSNGTNP
jgi:HEAT repeat protein